MEKLLNELVKRLQEAFGGDLLNVVLYGSAASGDTQDKFFDLNVMVVLREVSAADLRKAFKLVEWWVKQGQPEPLLISIEAARNAQDVFPIEFLDIHRSHRVLFGEDLFAQMDVDRAQHRRQVEHELRSGLLRLRQRYLLMQGKERDVVELLGRSLTTFATLARHALILAGVAAPAKKRETLDAAAAQFALDAGPFHTVLGIRQGAAPPAGEQLHALFAAYLEQVQKLAEAVDRL